MKPNESNFCGGNFQDWLEVMLTPECNGHCSWCVEKLGFHPDKSVHWNDLANIAMSTNKKNIILLGGEPTLYPHLKELITWLSQHNRYVWLTTNGSMLTPKFISDNLHGLKGINISIHSKHYESNKEITGVDIPNLEFAVKLLREGLGIGVRFNCNCIKGEVDWEGRLFAYLHWAKSMGADSVRFAELKNDEGNFVDLAKILNHEYGLNDDPYALGCNKNVIIDGIHVNFRQMCGLQTPMRKRPENPEQFRKQVLYYDGKIYDGWQLIKKEDSSMLDANIRKILESVKNGQLSVEGAELEIRKSLDSELKDIRKSVDDLNRRMPISNGGCVY